MAERTCSAEGCANKHRAKGLCITHYNRQLEPVSWCSLDGCDDPVHAKGWCRHHYESWRKRGDPTVAARNGKPEPPKHGTTSRYVARKCRCEDCSAAALAYMQEWRRNNKERWSELRRRSNRAARARLRGAASEPYSTADVMERDGWKCGLCGKRISQSHKYPHPRSASIDHIVPLSVGGDDTLANVQAAHLVCNVSKGNRPANDQLRLVG